MQPEPAAGHGRWLCVGGASADSDADAMLCARGVRFERPDGRGGARRAASPRPGAPNEHGADAASSRAKPSRAESASALLGYVCDIPSQLQLLTIIVPFAVLRELDGLKNSADSHKRCASARIRSAPRPPAHAAHSRTCQPAYLRWTREISRRALAGGFLSLSGSRRYVRSISCTRHSRRGPRGCAGRPHTRCVRVPHPHS